MCNFLLALFSFILILSPLVTQAKARTPIKIIDGKVEIVRYNRQIFRLEGEWRFADKNLKTIDEIQFTTLPLKNAYEANPYWTSYSPGPARGAFILRIDADASYSLLASSPAISARSQLLIVNDRGIKEAFVDPFYGQTSLEKTRRELSTPTFPLELVKGPNFLILNYEQKSILVGGIESVSAGFRGNFDIGQQQDLLEEILSEKVTLLIPTGIFLCLAVYSLLIYLSRRSKDQESLLLFGFNIMMFLKEIASQSTLGLFMQSNMFTQILASSVIYSTILTTFFGISVVYLAIKARFLQYLRFTVLGIATASCLINTILVLGSNIPNIIPYNMILIACNFTILFFAFLPYVIIYAIRSKRDDLVLLGVGYLALTGGVLFDFCKAVYGLDFPWMAMWGGTVLSVVFSKNNSKMFALTYERSEQLNSELQIKNAEVQDLNANLEDKVLERTAEINSLLQHIPQGILTIGEDACIGMNFSAHLPHMIGRSDIAGKSFKEVIFDRSELSRNQIDQAWQSILASLNEDALNFEVNANNLPMEFSFPEPHPIVLKCTWNVEVDAHNLVKRILVTLLDVSAEVEARKKLDARNREFNIVRQLIDIGSVKSKQFFTSGQQLIKENERLLASSAIDNETIKILFVNMHTLKGAARTLQFIDLSEEFHLVETYYADILRNGVAIDSLKLLADFKLALAIFEQYEHVNKVVLGRTEDDSKVVIDRNFLEQNFQILNFLDQTNSLDTNLKGVIHDNCDRLVKLIFMSLPLVLDETLKQAGRIAKDLQKVEPLVSIDMDDILISHKNEVAIKNAFVHLLRNSLDHGIESSDVRISKGKDPRGHIKISAQVQGEQLEMRFEDDGAGLAIGRLREKGLALALIKADAGVKEVGELIFHQGLSTAKTVSQISGRGVGMDAVRRFIEGESGQVELHLGDCIDEVKELYSFQIVIRLPSHETGQSIRGQVA